MRISEMMTTDVATVTEEASLNKAFQVLHDRRHKVLPVVRGERLVGLLSENLLAEVRPSKATALSVYEINYLMTRTKVRDVMIKLEDVFTIRPDALVEEAALALYTHDVGSLPVIQADGTLVGIITQTDIFKAFISLMGVNHKGTRLAIEVANDVGIVAKISRIVADAGVNIGHIGNYDKGEKQEVVLRVDTHDTSEIVNALEEAGIKVSDVQAFARISGA
ncbi:MAG: CBS and ACT domain-containing protein [Defluviitaleaceae bacterium]|nr:CBS and ACT domain-containing protein [Defluviitaleaceae bacterium]